jgi:hypothetical protein
MAVPDPAPPPAQTQLRVAHDGQPDPLPTTVPELHALITRLETELVEVRLQWKIEIGDLKSELQTQIGLRNAARRKLSELEGVGTPAGEVDELLDLWLDLEVRAGRRTKRTDIAKDDKPTSRYKVMQRAHKRWGYDRVRDAIRAGCAFPYISFGERVAEPPEPDSKPWTDVVHLVGDGPRIERCEAKVGHDPETDALVRRAAAKIAAARRAMDKRPPPADLRLDREPIDAYLEALDRSFIPWQIRWRHGARDTSEYWWETTCPVGDHPMILRPHARDPRVLVYCGADCDPKAVRRELRAVNDAWREWMNPEDAGDQAAAT